MSFIRIAFATAAVALFALAAPSASFAADAKPTMAKPAMTKKMHRYTCWDSAYNTPEWKECEATGGKAKPVVAKKMMKKPAAPKKA